MKKLYVFYLLLVSMLVPSAIGALDFGFLTNQYVSYGNPGGEDVLEYRAGFVPRFSTFFGDTGSLFISGLFTIGYKDDALYYVPELLRTDFSMRFGGFGIRLGRMAYSDPLGFITEGLFDGLQLTHRSNAGQFSLGAWYTGFLYKKTVNINMNINDQTIYNEELDYKYFANTYFAPKRMFASLDWEHPSVGEVLRIKTSFMGQIDLTDKDDKIHSQYFTLKFGLPAGRFLFELGGTLGMAQEESVGSAADNYFSAAGSFELFWALPTINSSHLSFTGYYASGKMNEDFTAFIPVTTKYFGEIFQAKLTGLTVLSLNYSGRLSETFGASLSASYYVRNDLVTPNSYPINAAANDNFFLGAEFFARFIWSPVSDLQLNLGGGAYIPALGNVWPDEKLQWKLELTAVVSIY